MKGEVSTGFDESQAASLGRYLYMLDLCTYSLVVSNPNYMYVF